MISRKRYGKTNKLVMETPNEEIHIWVQIKEICI